MNKRIQKKIAKRKETAKPQTVQEAFEVLYALLTQDPKWQRHSHCLFIDRQDYSYDYVKNQSNFKGSLYATGEGPRITTTEKFTHY